MIKTGNNAGAHTRFPGDSRIYLYLLLALLLLIFVSTVEAATVEKKSSQALAAEVGAIGYMAYGQGRQPCKAYLYSLHLAGSKKNFLQLNYFRQWMAGYMSSFNLFYLSGSSAIAGKGDEGNIENELAMYCQKKPDEPFALAAAAVIKKLHADQQ